MSINNKIISKVNKIRIWNYQRVSGVVKNGWKFKRHGGNHDVYEKDGKRESIVRHRETDEDLARAIIKRNGLK
jgi:mRNA interferase HicA